MLKVQRPIPASIKFLIFDLDGTLIDSRADLVNSVNGMLRHFGRKELPADVVATYIGDGAPMLVRRALGDPADDRYFQDALRYFLDFYREHKLDHTTVYDGVLPALEEMRDARQMAVLTNKPVNPSRAIVEALGLGKFFAQVYGGNSFPTKKPDPAGALQLMAEFGVRPEETLMIGDSSIDVLTGRNCGMWTCGCTYGFSPHTLEQAPPDALVDHPSELPLVLGAAPPEQDAYEEIAE
jgi:phosphoglycolate phosphatase